MPKRSSKVRKAKKTAGGDSNEIAASIVETATAESGDNDAKPTGKNPAAVALGRLGGKKGGPARARKLSKERRVEIAKKAAKTRWTKARRPGAP
jgi:hypothetical protein